MKRKKKFNYGILTPIILGLIFVAIIVAIIVLPKYFPNLFEGMFKFNLPKGLTLKDFETPPDSSCTFTFDKSIACTGEDVTGEIRDGPSNSCVVAYNYESSDWKIYNVEVLDSGGFVSETASADIPGNYIWTAICGKFEDEVFFPECRTNNVEIEIIVCDDSDGDGYTDEEEIEAGTDPNDPNDYPNSGVTYTCGAEGDYNCQGTCPNSYWCGAVYFGGYDACACIDGDNVHPDWKPGGVYHNPLDNEEEDAENWCISQGMPDYSYTGLSSDECSQLAYNTCLPDDYAWIYENDENWCCFECIQEYDNCYSACNGIISPVYGAGKPMSELRIPYNCDASADSYCEYVGGSVRNTEYNYWDLNCCCWQCQIWE